jgi:hypothetical protein
MRSSAEEGTEVQSCDGKVYFAFNCMCTGVCFYVLTSTVPASSLQIHMRGLRTYIGCPWPPDSQTSVPALPCERPLLGEEVAMKRWLRSTREANGWCVRPANWLSSTTTFGPLDAYRSHPAPRPRPRRRRRHRRRRRRRRRYHQRRACRPRRPRQPHR